MSGLPYLASDGTSWLLLPPEGDGPAWDDETGHHTAPANWKASLSAPAFGYPAGTELVAASDIGMLRDAVEAFVESPLRNFEPPKRTDPPKAKASGGWLLLALLAWMISEGDKKGRA